jgi:hypothetical protein
MSGTQSNSIARVYDSLSGRNRIINGNCNIAQRASLAYTTGVSGYSGPDRFTASNGNSAGGQFTQAQGTITFNGVAKNAVVQTVNTAISSTTTTNYWLGIRQYIEGYNAFDLLGQNISVSFIFNTNVSGTYSMTLQDGSNSNSYLTTFSAVANTPTYYTFVIPTIPTGAAIPNSNAIGLAVTIGAINTGTFQTSNVGSWQSGNFIAASGSTNWGLTIGNFIALTELQLEHGNIATPFEREAYSITFQKCQRYYTVLTGVQVAGYAGSAGNITTAAITLPVAMRVTPTTAQSSTSQNNCTGMTLNPTAGGQVIETFGNSATASTNFYAMANIACSAEL